MNQFDLKNKTAVITGGAQGFGLDIAKKFLDYGAKVRIWDIDEEELKKAIKNIDNSNLQYDTVNVADFEVVTDTVKKISKNSKIDILINNAGNAHGLDDSVEADLDDWDLMIDTNLKGLIYVTKAILPSMISRGRGHIINVGSIAGKEVYPKGNVYCASKFGVNAFNSGLRIDLNKTGIKVGIINPGKVKTEFSNVRFKGDSIRAKKVYEGLKVLSAVDVANAIFYMANVPDHVNISDLEILPNSEANTYIVNRNL